MNKHIIAVLGVIALIALGYFGLGFSSKDNSALAENSSGASVDLTTDAGKLGYTVGTQIGRDLAQSGMGNELDSQALTQGLKDALSGAAAQMTNDEMLAAQQAFQLKRQQEYAAQAAKNLSDGEAFLEKNKSEDGIVTTDSGLQYQVVREGKGDKPVASDTVKVHYLGTLTDSTPFDSSYSRNAPAEFPVGGVIPGFAEGLQLMQEGAKYRFVIPSSLAYGEQAPPNIGPNQVLIFEVELLEILNPAAPAGE